MTPPTTDRVDAWQSIPLAITDLVSITYRLAEADVIEDAHAVADWRTADNALLGLLDNRRQFGPTETASYLRSLRDALACGESNKRAGLR